MSLAGGCVHTPLSTHILRVSQAGIGPDNFAQPCPLRLPGFAFKIGFGDNGTRMQQRVECASPPQGGARGLSPHLQRRSSKRASSSSLILFLEQSSLWFPHLNLSPTGACSFPFCPCTLSFLWGPYSTPNFVAQMKQRPLHQTCPPGGQACDPHLTNQCISSSWP